MRLPHNRIAFAASLVVALSCAKSATTCDAGTGACASPPDAVAAVGQDVVLSVGQSVQIDGARIQLERIAEDSRCPSDVQCVWAGNARVALRVSKEGVPERGVELNTTVGAKDAAIDGHVLRLVGVSPTPTSTGPIPSGSYRVTLRLERAQ
jgi:hypothetical protein